MAVLSNGGPSHLVKNKLLSLIEYIRNPGKTFYEELANCVHSNREEGPRKAATAEQCGFLSPELRRS